MNIVMLVVVTAGGCYGDYDECSDLREALPK